MIRENLIVWDCYFVKIIKLVENDITLKESIKEIMFYKTRLHKIFLWSWLKCGIITVVTSRKRVSNKFGGW